MLSRRYKRKRGIPFKSKGYMRRTGYYGRFNNPRGNNEMKFLDTLRATVAVSNTGTITNDTVCVIPQNATESGRIGRKVTIKRIHIKGQYILNTSSTVATGWNKVRVIVYVDKQSNGATATVADLLDSTTVNSFRNLQNSSRFVFIHDKTYSKNIMAGGGVTGSLEGWENASHLSINKRCNIVMEYDDSAATGALTTIRSNNIGIMCITSEATPAMSIAYTVRVRYSDN